MRIVSKRFSRKAGNAFLVELRDGLFALGVMHTQSLVTFSKRFYQDSQADVDLKDVEDKLFSVSIQMSFFRNSKIYPCGNVDANALAGIPVQSELIRPRARPFDPQNPFGHDGPFPYQGGDLVTVRDPLSPASASDATVVRSNLSCETDLSKIVATEISALYVNHDIKERLVACHLSGQNVDAFKARVFDDCDALVNEYVLATHWYKPKQMPLLGLVLNEAKNSWEPAP